MKPAFEACHPAVNLLYFSIIIFSAMFCMHPLILAVAGVSGMVYFLWLKRGKSVLKTFSFLVIVAAIAAVMNPLFNHQGMTVLFYLPNQNPVTLEAVIFGLASGLMLASVLLWFSCASQILTGDKFLHITGKVFPVAAMILTMSLRFIPKFHRQAEKAMRAQQGLGRDGGSDGVWKRAAQGMRVFSVMMTWALENSVDTADSMKARGYGTGKRSSFSLYRWDKRDSVMLVLMLSSALCFFTVFFRGEIGILYFPQFSMNGTGSIVSQAAGYVSFSFLAFLPLSLDILEALRWNYLQSKI